MLEPDVTITDFALAMECAVFALLLARRGAHGTTNNRLFALTFAALGASSLFGGIWHGFFSGTETQAGHSVWFATMAALACAAFMLWQVAAAWIATSTWAGRIRAVALVQFVGQLATSAFITDAFVIGAAGMMPPIAFVAVLYAKRYRAIRSPRALSGVAGFALAVRPTTRSGFAKGGDFNKKHANRIMRYRIYAQAVAVVLILLFVWIRRGG